MNNFITMLHEIKVASTETIITVTDQFENISGINLLAKLAVVYDGAKTGAHWIRTAMKIDDTGKCKPRNNENTESMARLVIIDADCSINGSGEEVEGAPDPLQVSEILKTNNIGHILYGSYSHYTGAKGNRYRILLITKSSYNREQLPSTAERVVLLINTGLSKTGLDSLAYARENDTWAQPWYYPRKSASSTVNQLYYEYLEGTAIDVVDPVKLPFVSHSNRKNHQTKVGEISPIQAFNEQKNLTNMLSYYGYKRMVSTKDHEKWLSPNSSSGVAGITVKDNKFFSHHSDVFNDGYWHDCWDLWRNHENLTEHDAIREAAKNLYLPDGRTIDEHNKSLINKRPLQEFSEQTSISFAEYKPFNEELLPVESVPYQALPDQMANFIKEQSKIRGCPPDYVLVSLLARMGCLFSGKVKIALTRNSGWHASPNFFWVMIGDPSSGKSNALSVTNKPIQMLEAMARELYKKEYRAHKAEMDALERQLNSIIKGMDGENKKSNCDYSKIRQYEERLRVVQQNIYELEDNKPKLKHYTVNKLTVEKLILILEENPEGLLLELDELSSLFVRLSHVGKSYEFVASLSAYLYLYENNGQVTSDKRIQSRHILYAIKLGKYFSSHAQRMYGLAYRDEMPARSLSEKLAKLVLSSTNGEYRDNKTELCFFTRSQIRSKGWTELNAKEQRREAINSLIARGYISKPLGDKYYINPEYLNE